jgi:hypothetical protein
VTSLRTVTYTKEVKYKKIKFLEPGSKKIIEKSEKIGNGKCFERDSVFR